MHIFPLYFRPQCSHFSAATRSDFAEMLDFQWSVRQTDRFSLRLSDYWLAPIDVSQVDSTFIVFVIFHFAAICAVEVVQGLESILKCSETASLRLVNSKYCWASDPARGAAPFAQVTPTGCPSFSYTSKHSLSTLRACLIGLNRISKTYPSTMLITWDEMRRAAMRDRSIEIRMRESWNLSRPLAGAGACQAHPNSSVIFRMSWMSSDDSSGFGWAKSNASTENGGVFLIRMSPIEHVLSDHTR